MMGLYLDELEVGASFALGHYKFSDENILAFCNRFAPSLQQPNAQLDAQTGLSKLAASGFHVLAAWMPRFVATNTQERERLAALGKTLPEVGAGFGLSSMVWFHAVFAGDEISWQTTLLSKRPLNSKPKWGLVEVQNKGFRGLECVTSFRSSMLVARR